MGFDIVFKDYFSMEKMYVLKLIIQLL